MNRLSIYVGDAIEQLRGMPASSVDCVITSPPYWNLRDYGHEGQIGLEETPEAFIQAILLVFQEVRRVLVPRGTCWVNMGDSYTSGNRGYRAPDKKNPARAMTVRPDTPGGLKPKDLIGMPWRVALALQADGWYLRQDIIWNKPNPMPESVTDRCTKAHEYLFLLSKSERYYFDSNAIREPRTSDEDTDGKRKRRSVWTIATQPFKEAHFATFPEALVEPCVLAGCAEGGIVLDPFMGSGTTGVVALRNHRRFVGIELNPKYAAMATRRIQSAIPGPSLFVEAK